MSRKSRGSGEPPRINMTFTLAPDFVGEAALNARRDALEAIWPP
jgi:hypothetical protein